MDKGPVALAIWHCNLIDGLEMGKHHKFIECAEARDQLSDYFHILFISFHFPSIYVIAICHMARTVIYNVKIESSTSNNITTECVS